MPEMKGSKILVAKLSNYAILTSPTLSCFCRRRLAAGKSEKK